MQTLPYTPDEVRERELVHVGRTGRPNPWWPGGPTTNDCVGYQTERLGLRTGRETVAELGARRHFISISAFRAHYRYPEVAAKDLRSGMLLLSNWSGRRVDGQLEAEHMEYLYSRTGDTLMIVGANTGPRAGAPEPNGVWKKTRPLDGHIIRGIVLPYRDQRPTRSRKHVVQTVAAFLNEQKLGDIRPSTAAGPGPNTGIEGPNYWRRVQTWGRHEGLYPSRFVIDAIPGSQSRIVEAAAYQAATAKK